ncbi:MAG: polysaccharide deacetylase family protein [Bacteroidetes bacterium]|nr:MAG: polysaccharide deacetylase family protein [Bacteroidota bacterium]
MFYFTKTPWILKKFYSECIWEIPSKEKIIYLTFDDGPHPIATPFVLDELKKYNAKATFFCIGKNVVEEKNLYRRILDEGHRVGNHTYNHLNGWKTDDLVYLENILTAAKFIDSKLFRPPYGRISKFQIRNLNTKFGYNIVMWTVLSGDFDTKISGNVCAEKVLLKAGPGSIVVFHDSEKAFDRLRYALPIVLKQFSEQGYRFEKINL